jgi:hypothetical protein
MRVGQRLTEAWLPAQHTRRWSSPLPHKGIGYRRRRKGASARPVTRAAQRRSTTPGPPERSPESAHSRPPEAKSGRTRSPSAKPVGAAVWLTRDSAMSTEYIPGREIVQTNGGSATSAASEIVASGPCPAGSASALGCCGSSCCVRARAVNLDDRHSVGQFTRHERQRRSAAAAGS